MTGSDHPHELGGSCGAAVNLQLAELRKLNFYAGCLHLVSFVAILRRYIVLCFVAKSLLAWQVFAGTLAS